MTDFGRVMTAMVTPFKLILKLITIEQANLLNYLSRQVQTVL